jgi:hypothetical protein
MLIAASPGMPIGPWFSRLSFLSYASLDLGFSLPYGFVGLALSVCGSLLPQKRAFLKLTAWSLLSQLRKILGYLGYGLDPKRFMAGPGRGNVRLLAITATALASA